MKSRINHLLPIAFALFLPGVSYFSGNEFTLLDQSSIYQRWLTSSFFLYINWYIFWYLNQLKYPGRIYGFIGLFLLIICINFSLDKSGPDEFIGPNLVRFLFVSTLILTIQYAVKAQENISRLQLEKEQIQTENYRVQLQALRNQVDPHFLFNSLNTLRSMVRQQNRNSEQFIMSLSDFYRQTLKHNENTTLPLSEELKVLQSYLFLMKSRNEEAVKVKLKVDALSDSYHLPSLALQVVVENCFKHNSMTSRNPLRIDICNGSVDTILVKNNQQPKLGKSEPSGFGLDSLKKRYELMNHPDGIKVEESPDTFVVELKLIKK